jgi:membrane-bound lytic murein transglycosylase MltF
VLAVRCLCLAVSFFLFFSPDFSAYAQSGEQASGTESEEEAAEDHLVAALSAPWTGDLDGILKRSYIRVGVPYDPLFFWYDGATQQGLSVELGAEFEKHLRKTLGPNAKHMVVVLTPLPRNAMISGLTDGRVDLLAANLTITPERAGIVDFAAPSLTGISELLVLGPAAPEVKSVDDLARSAVHVRRSSSYFEHLSALNAERAAVGKPPIPIVEADENLEDHDLLELVDVGVIPAVIVDSHKMELYSQIFQNLVATEDLAVHRDGEIAWAMRKNSPKLKDAVNAFMKKAKKGTALGNVLYRRWIKDTDRVRNAVAPGEDAKFTSTISIIRKHASSYDFEPVLIAAQGYQESGLDQSKRSHAGAIGIMQVMPATARDPNVGIPNITVAESNVEAGVKYLRFLRDRYYSDPEITEFNRVMFSFGAYNAGPGNMAKARRRAAKMGLDPNVWFGNVEIAAAKSISREPVVYVRNILKYYVTFQRFDEQRSTRQQ